MRRALLLALLVGCGGAAQSTELQAAPTAIGASDALREEEQRAARGTAAAALAEMAEADLTTEAGREVLGFSAASAMLIGSVVMFLGGIAEEPPNDCYEIEVSEASGTRRSVVRADRCRTQATDQKHATGTLVVEERETECGEWSALTLRSWTSSDERPCGSTGSPKGTRSYDGRVTVDECQGTFVLDLVIDGEGLEEIDGECRPVRRTALRYRLTSGDMADSEPMNGEGEVGISGVGRATVETIDQQMARDDCTTEAASGITRARAGGHVAEVRYDGATECSDPGSAPLFLDGAPAGATEHACAAGGSGPGAFTPLLLLLVLRRRRVDG